MYTFITFILLFLCMTPASSQVILTSEDFFTLGDAYTVMANERQTFVDVTGAIGMPGQNVWDFTTFSSLTPRPLTYDYVETSSGEFGGEILFPAAAFARRLTDDTFDIVDAYIYLSQDSQGQQVHGAYIPIFPAQPELIYTPAFINRPFPLTFGQSWTIDTTYDQLIEVELFGGFLTLPLPTRNVTHTDVTVDAFGSITLPELGTLNCLRIHELLTQDVYVDFFGIGAFEYFETITSRSYAWVAEGADEVVRITSQLFRQSTPPMGIPPVDFTTASILQIQISNSRSTLSTPN